MGEPLRIMSVVCHPADAIDGAGGTFALHADRGDRVTVVVCTHGVDTHDLRRNDALRFRGTAKADDHGAAIDRKEEEIVEGLAILGVTDVRFLRFPDELLMVGPELVTALATVMAEVQPDLLITHNPTEEGGLADVGHADSALAALKARYLANTPRFLTAPTGRVFPAQVFFLCMNAQTSQLSAEGTRYASVLVDITPVVERKVRAIDCLRSQYLTGHLARKIVEDVNGAAGLHWVIPYAEAFQPMYPHAYDALPVNDHLMWLARTPVEERFARLRITVTDVPVDADAIAVAEGSAAGREQG